MNDEITEGNIVERSGDWIRVWRLEWPGMLHLVWEITKPLEDWRKKRQDKAAGN